ncbi:MAG: hypothetical protein ACRC6V_09940 [Bacteroidales bacterium]
MQVVLADGRTLGFRNQYDLAKFILFGAPRLGIPITSAPELKVTPETEPLFRIKRRIDKRRLEKAINEFEDDSNIPF